MKTHFHRRISTGSLAAALSLMLCSAPAFAADPVVKTEKKAPGVMKERLLSIVVLLPAPRTLDEADVSALVLKAVGADHIANDGKPGFIIAKPPHFLINLKTGSYVLNNINQPYVEDVSKQLNDIQDPALRKSLTAHHAWVSIDWAGTTEPDDIRKAYQDMGKIATTLAGDKALAVYNPEIDDFVLYTPAVGTLLSSEDPLQAFAAPGTIYMRDDNPQLLEAQALAQKEWPVFLKAFRDKAGSEFAVKGRIIEGDRTEFLWLNVDSIDATKVHGKLDNKPASFTGLKMGEDLHINISEVDDWLYLDKEKKPVGGYTIKVFDKLVLEQKK
jgi:uncharacterized protein YegJ (DUF2314 family)